MLLTGFHLVTNLLNKYRTMQLRNLILALLRCAIRIHIFQFLGRHKCDIFRKITSNVLIFICHIVLGHFQCLVNRTDNGFQCLTGTIFFTDDLLPVPLIHINGMDVVCILITTNRAHVGVKAFTFLKSVLF